MASLFNKIKSGVMDLFGLGKANNSNQSLLDKAKNFVKKGVDFFRNKSVQKGIDMFSNLIGSNAPRDFFQGAKKYANIGNNIINNKAVDKKVNRFADRFQRDMAENNNNNIELQPRRNRRDDDNFNLTSIFG